MYKLKSSTSWLTTGKIPSTSASYDLRNIKTLLGIDIDEIQYRLIVYYKNVNGSTTTDFSDAAYIYSLIFTPTRAGTLKIYDGKQTTQYPVFSSINNNNLEKLKINTSGGQRQVPLVASNHPLAGKAKVKTNSGVKNFATETANFTYDTSKLTTYGTSTTSYNQANEAIGTSYHPYTTIDPIKYTYYTYTYGTAYKLLYTTAYNTLYSYYKHNYTSSYTNYTTYLSTLPYATSYYKYGAYEVVGSYSHSYVKYSTPYGPVMGGYGGPIWGYVIKYAPLTYGSYIGVRYYTGPAPYAYVSSYSSLPNYNQMTQYGPKIYYYKNYSYRYYNTDLPFGYTVSQANYSYSYYKHTYYQQYNKQYYQAYTTYYKNTLYNYYNNYATAYYTKNYNYIDSYTPINYSYKYQVS